MSELVWMEKDGTFLEINIDTVKAHEAMGWKISTGEDKSAVKEAKARIDKAEAERVKAAAEAAALFERERVRAEQVKVESIDAEKKAAKK